MSEETKDALIALCIIGAGLIGAAAIGVWTDWNLGDVAAWLGAL